MSSIFGIKLLSAEPTSYKIVVGGVDITSRVTPYLLSLAVSLQAGTVSDQATIEVDDTNGRIKLPKDGDEARVSIAGIEVFRGKVNDVSSSGSKSGRKISIACTGMDTKGKAKEPRHKHYDKKKVSEILSDAGKYADVQDVKIDSELGNVVLDYVQQTGESFVHLANRLSIMLGGTFKIMGDKAVMVKRNAGRSASGKPLVTIRASWGTNLIDWQITPLIGRPRHKAVQARWYDTKKAKWVTEKADTKDSGATATSTVRYHSGGEEEAKSRSKADSAEADRNKGDGTITIDGDARAQPEAKCILAGARAGIDGQYLIDGVEHKLDRGGGFTTSLKLKYPSGGAGSDGRN